jgi:ubiquinone/menaquinone biosynthesis C-methylase UbiE
MSERTFDDFDEFAEDYRAIHTANVKLSGADSFYFARMKIELLQLWEKNKQAIVLDIGCGDGATELFMQQYFPKWKVNAIDISVRSIITAEKRNIDTASFSVYDGLTIPFKDESFDVVFMAGVLHHIDLTLHQTIIKEIHRVLKKEGRLYVFEHNPLNPLTKYLVKTCIFDKDARLLRSNYTSGLLKQHQLSITDKDFIIFFPRKGLLSKFIFIEKWLKWLPFGGQYLIRAKK